VSEDAPGNICASRGHEVEVCHYPEKPRHALCQLAGWVYAECSSATQVRKTRGNLTAAEIIGSDVAR